MVGFKMLSVAVTLTFLIVFLPLTVAHGQEKVGNFYFAMKVPKTWTYAEYSNTGMASLLGKGPINYVISAPGDFGQIIAHNDDDDRSYYEKLSGGGAFGEFSQDTDYNLKNAPLYAYVKYRADQQGDNWNVTSMDNGTIGKQKAVKISANGTNEFDNLRKVEYLVLNDKDAYSLIYAANVKDYDKYLPEFEAMVKSFKFVN
jgi:VCBS repeat-containing protein